MSKNSDHQEVVRLTTSHWRDDRGLHIKKSIVSLKRHSFGHQVLTEDCGMVGSEEVVKRIKNLSECKDGLYKVGTCNEKTDWETGCVDEYDYTMIPFVPPAPDATAAGRTQ